MCQTMAFGLGTVDYQDSTAGPYSHEWEIDPMLYQGLRTIGTETLVT